MFVPATLISPRGLWQTRLACLLLRRLTSRPSSCGSQPPPPPPACQHASTSHLSTHLQSHIFQKEKKIFQRCHPNENPSVLISNVQQENISPVHMLTMRVGFSLLGYPLSANIHHRDRTNDVLNMLLLTFPSRNDGSDNLLRAKRVFQRRRGELCRAAELNAALVGAGVSHSATGGCRCLSLWRLKDHLIGKPRLCVVTSRSG